MYQTLFVIWSQTPTDYHVGRKGVIRKDRPHLSAEKSEFATEEAIDTLEEAINGADVFIGLSMADILSPEMLRTMAKDPIVFAMANPNPEIEYNLACATRGDVIMATGRSDHPNQVNNVLGFPFIFRGALDVRATTINEPMKMAAVKALAALAKEPVPEQVNVAYDETRLTFGREYSIPKPFDPRLFNNSSCGSTSSKLRRYRTNNRLDCLCRRTL